jgi:hypothetical protein
MSDVRGEFCPPSLITTAFSYEFLLPGELAQYGNSLAAAVLSYANVYFWTQADYFKPDL